MKVETSNYRQLIDKLTKQEIPPKAGYFPLKTETTYLALFHCIVCSQRWISLRAFYTKGNFFLPLLQLLLSQNLTRPNRWQFRR